MQKVIIDTSIWIEFFRTKASPHKDIVQQLILEDEVYMVGPVLAELYSGVKSNKEMKTLENRLHILKRIDATDNTWKNAGKMIRKFRQAGVTLKTIDSVIAQLAIENNAYLYTLDGDFKKINAREKLLLYISSG